MLDIADSKILIVGYGNAGGSLFKALLEKNVFVKLLTRNKYSDDNYTWGDLQGDIIEKFDVIIIAVQDKYIKEVADKIRSFNSSAICLHLSGFLTSDVLGSANAGSFHPIQTFIYKDADNWKNIYIGIEGNTEVLKFMHSLAIFLGSKALTIPKDKKPLYHFASVTASNLLIGQMHLLKQVSDTVFSNKENFIDVFAPIINKTINNIIKEGYLDALTGPLNRGESEVIIEELIALKKNNLNHLEAYKALCISTAEAAYNKGAITEEKYLEIINKIDKV